MAVFYPTGSRLCLTMSFSTSSTHRERSQTSYPSPCLVIEWPSFWMTTCRVYISAGCPTGLWVRITRTRPCSRPERARGLSGGTRFAQTTGHPAIGEKFRSPVALESPPWTECTPCGALACFLFSRLWDLAYSNITSNIILHYTTIVAKIQHLTPLRANMTHLKIWTKFK